MFIEPQGASHGELYQPCPQFQADSPQSAKVYGRIKGHYILPLSLLNVIWRLLPEWRLLLVWRLLPGLGERDGD